MTDLNGREGPETFAGAPNAGAAKGSLSEVTPFECMRTAINAYRAGMGQEPLEEASAPGDLKRKYDDLMNGRLPHKPDTRQIGAVATFEVE